MSDVVTVTHLTYDQVVNELLKALKTRGEMFIYPDDWRDDFGMCQYTLSNGAAGCIVGQVLQQVGADIQQLKGVLGGVGDAAKSVGVTLDDDACGALQIAQNMQDEGTPWGTVVSWIMMDPERA